MSLKTLDSYNLNFPSEIYESSRPPISSSIEIEETNRKSAYHIYLKRDENAYRPSIPLRLRIGASFKNFFTDRLSHYFRGIFLSFKSEENEIVLKTKVAAAMLEIKNALRDSKFGEEERYPLLSKNDALFMEGICRKTTKNGMERARILDIQKKVEKRVETYIFIEWYINKFLDNGKIHPKYAQDHQFILETYDKLTGEDGLSPRPLDKKERKRLLQLISSEHLHEAYTEGGNLVSLHAPIDFQALADALFLPIEKIEGKESEEPDLFAEYIQNKKAKYSAKLIKLAKADYAHISARYRLITTHTGRHLHSPRTKAQNGDAIPDLTQETLMKIVRKANLALFMKKEGDSGASISIITGPKYNRILRHLLIKRTEEGLQVIEWSGLNSIQKDSPLYLGAGSYGTVQIAFNITRARIAALKLAKIEEAASAEKQSAIIINEEVKLTALHTKRKERGLQHRPVATINIASNSEDQPICGYWGTYYNYRSLQYAIEVQNFLSLSFSASEKLRMALSLFLGLKKLQTPTKDRGPILHGDIKPANILLHRNRDGSFSLALSDFGDAKDLRKELSFSKRDPTLPLGTIITPGFFTKTDRKRLHNADSQKTWELYQMKRDIFALAASEWKLLLGEVPYGVNKQHDNEAADTRKGIDKGHFRLFTRLYGEELGNLFANALDENPDARPSVNELITGIKHAITNAELIEKLFLMM